MTVTSSQQLSKRDKIALYLGLSAGDLIEALDRIESERVLDGSVDGTEDASKTNSSGVSPDSLFVWLAASLKMRGHNPTLWAVCAIAIIEGIKVLSPDFFSFEYLGYLLLLLIFGLSFLEGAIDSFQVKMAANAVSEIERLNLSRDVEYDLIKRKGSYYTLNRRIAMTIVVLWIGILLFLSVNRIFFT